VLVTGVRRLDRIAPGAHPEDRIDDVPEWDVVVVGPVNQRVCCEPDFRGYRFRG
jgi:hypothetical protein